MKVRRKYTPTIDSATHEVAEESAHCYVCYRNGVGEGAGYYALEKEHYEPVPEATWTDVTPGCEYQPRATGGYVFKGCENIGHINDGYRLRKVTLTHVSTGAEIAAFVVDQRETL